MFRAAAAAAVMLLFPGTFCAGSLPLGGFLNPSAQAKPRSASPCNEATTTHTRISTSTSATWASCSPNSLFTPSSVQVAPDPPPRGQTTTATINGTMGTAVDSGELLVSVYYHGFKVFSQHGDVCIVTDCPIVPGTARFEVQWVMPSLAPPGPYRIQLMATTSSPTEALSEGRGGSSAGDVESTGPAGGSGGKAAKGYLAAARRWLSQRRLLPRSSDAGIPEQARAGQQEVDASSARGGSSSSSSDGGSEQHAVHSKSTDESSPIFCIEIFFDLA